MIIEVILLSGFLFSRSKKLAKKQQELQEKAEDDPAKELSVAEDRMRKMVGSPEQREAFRLQNNEEMLSGYAALTCATAGALIYTPLSLLSIPFLFYSTKNFHKRTYKMLTKGKVSTDTLISMIVFYLD